MSENERIHAVVMSTNYRTAVASYVMSAAYILASGFFLNMLHSLLVVHCWHFRASPALGSESCRNKYNGKKRGESLCALKININRLFVCV